MEDTTAATTEITNVLLDMVMETTDVAEFLTELTRFAASTLASQTASEILCAVTLLRPRTAATVASSSAYARKMDEVQYSFDDGPCLRAAREGHVVHVTDMPADERFPEYRDAVAEHGIRSALGVPVPLDGDANAGLDFYAKAPQAFDDDAVSAAQHFAQEASQSLRLALRIARLSDTSKNLEAAMQSRTNIDLAVGIIMAQNRCTQDEAVKILKSASSARNIKLRDIAATVVASTGQTSTQTHFER